MGGDKKNIEYSAYYCFVSGFSRELTRDDFRNEYVFYQKKNPQKKNKNARNTKPCVTFNSLVDR